MAEMSGQTVDLLEVMRADVVEGRVDQTTINLARIFEQSFPERWNDGDKYDWVKFLAGHDGMSWVWVGKQSKAMMEEQDLKPFIEPIVPAEMPVLSIPMPDRLRLAVKDYQRRNITKEIPHSHMEKKGATARLVVDLKERQVCCMPVSDGMLYTHCLSYSHVARVWSVPPATLHEAVKAELFKQVV
jgi:hypothetical protein